MKKIILFFIILFMCDALINAQAVKKEVSKVQSTQNNAEIPGKTKQLFAKDFLNAPVTKWEKTPGYDKATFLNNGEVANAYYNHDSKLVGTIIDKKITDLPVNAQNYIKDKYGDYDIESVALYDDNEINTSNIVLYSRGFDNWDNYFVKLKKNGSEIMLKISLEGEVSIFNKNK